jgi:hypothetical protein
VNTAPASTGKPCRVTIVGTARSLSAMPGMLRMTTEWGAVLLIDTGCLDTSVEWLDPITTWTDGDVVAGGGSTVLTRQGGKWHQVTEHGVTTAYDADVTDGVASGAMSVVRRQVA